MLTEQVIADGSLRATASGLSFDIRIPWYRSLPYSCVEGLEVVIDGEAVDPAALTIALDDATYATADLAPLFDHWWYVADPATVTVPFEADPMVREHELDVTLSMRIPYIIESEVPLVMRERCVKTMTAEGAGT